MNFALRSSIVWKSAAVAALFFLLTILYLGLWQDSSHIPSAQLGKPAKTFSLVRLDSEGQINLSDFKGKWVMLNFWASWCGACKEEHKLLVKTGNQLLKETKVSLVGVNFKDRKKNALNFLKKHGEFPYPSGLDPRGRTGIDFGVYGLPETFFIDPNGKIISRHVGALTQKIINRELNQALNGGKL